MHSTPELQARPHRVRPDRLEYYMLIAMAVRKRANCLGNRVGAVLVLNDRIVSTGYNGTPQGMPNCDDGGCERCANRERYRSAHGYDVCICVHAEQNAIVFAARHGNATQGGVLYTTLRPCFGCAKEAIQAGIRRIVFAEPFAYASELEEVYRRLIEEAGVDLRHVPA